MPVADTEDEFLVITEGKYIPIKLAGEGREGQVWYAVPTPAVYANAEIPHPTSSASYLNPPRNYTDGAIRRRIARVTNMDGLKAQLCAVKLSSSWRSVEKETNILERVQRAARIERVRTRNATITARFTDITEVDPRLFDWYSMRAIHGFCLGQKVFESQLHYPEGFIAHMALQLHEAFFWLHGLNPPIVHGDLVRSNIMVDMDHQDFPGLPNIVVIDFGRAKFLGDSRSVITHRITRSSYLNAGRRSFYDIVHRFATCGLEYDPHDDVWHRFIQAMAPALPPFSPAAMEHEEFKTLFYDMLVKRRESISGQQRALLDGWFAEMMRTERYPTDQQIRAAVEEAYVEDNQEGWHNEFRFGRGSI